MMLLKAVKMAIEKHKSQTRRHSGLPYVIHPISVAILVSENKSSRVLDELMAAAVLHDTLEDTETTFEEIAKEFSPLVASLVYELTSDPKQIEEIGKNQYLTKKMVGMSNYGLLLKLADRLSNVMDAPTESYKSDTADMIYDLECQRKLTDSQKRIVTKIKECIVG